jgi:hypothetical protein
VPPTGGPDDQSGGFEVFSTIDPASERPTENTDVTVTAFVSDWFDNPIEGAAVTFTWDYPPGSGMADVVTNTTTEASGIVSDTQNAGPDTGTDDWVTVIIRATHQGAMAGSSEKFNPAACSSG